LISTGTWCISLNPFNEFPLTDSELQQDCLCYLSYTGKPVKASRLFAGHEHELQTTKLAEHFNKEADYYKSLEFDSSFVPKDFYKSRAVPGSELVFPKIDLPSFDSYERAYHQLLADIVAAQFKSTNLVLQGTAVKTIYVDGGFSRNQIYMTLLALAYPGIHVYAATVPQASALGAAMAVHEYWNEQPLPINLIELRSY
jgi:sugar (pentulose or hexulose) kinase